MFYVQVVIPFELAVNVSRQASLRLLERPNQGGSKAHASVPEDA